MQVNIRCVALHFSIILLISFMLSGCIWSSQKAEKVEYDNETLRDQQYLQGINAEMLASLERLDELVSSPGASYAVLFIETPEERHGFRVVLKQVSLHDGETEFLGYIDAAGPGYAQQCFQHSDGKCVCGTLSNLTGCVEVPQLTMPSLVDSLRNRTWLAKVQVNESFSCYLSNESIACLENGDFVYYSLLYRGYNPVDAPFYYESTRVMLLAEPHCQSAACLGQVAHSYGSIMSYNFTYYENSYSWRGKNYDVKSRSLKSGIME